VSPNGRGTLRQNDVAERQVVVDSGLEADRVGACIDVGSLQTPGLALPNKQVRQDTDAIADVVDAVAVTVSPLESTDNGGFVLDEAPSQLQELAPLEPDMLRVEVEHISVDAGTRTMLRGEGFHMQVGIGETVRAGGVGRVVESTAAGWEPGQAVRGGLGAQTIATVKRALRILA